MNAVDEATVAARGPQGLDAPIAVELRDVVKRFGGVVALNRVSLTARRGQVTALIGDNGAGKSTIIRCLSGVHQPDEGHVLVDGEPVTLATPLDARAAGIQTVFQELALADNLDIAANIFLGRELKRGVRGLFRLRKRQMEAEAEAVLSRYGIRMPSAKSSVNRLSGGQRQGVAIARAVGAGGTTVLMDEPTAALGVQETARVLEIVRSLAENGIAVLLISHNLQQVMEVSDHIWVLRSGNMVAGMPASQTSSQELVHYITTGQAM
jgi:ABC-type sugar transport system ATPase subunit